jgi:hypothetical protein
MTTMQSTPVAGTTTHPVLKSRLPATCNHCSWTGNRSNAELHESDVPGHQVTVWDSPTSQLPRQMWAAPVTFPRAS